MTLRTIGLGLFLVGCATTKFRPIQTNVTAPEVQASLEDLGAGKAGLIVIKVSNKSTQTLTVNRDGIVLRTPKGDRKREAGGLQSAYVVAPGGSQSVNVKFAVGDLDAGMQVSLSFDDALMIDSRKVGLAPMTFAIDER